MKTSNFLEGLGHRICQLALLALGTRCAGNRRLPLAHGRLLSALLGATMIGTGWDAAAQTVTINPGRDNSIYEESNNSNALGGLFAGTTAGGYSRRALLSFDLSAIPAGSRMCFFT